VVAAWRAGTGKREGALGAASDSLAVWHRPGSGARGRRGVARRVAGRTREGERG
jgi:hypothetical protein